MHIASSLLRMHHYHNTSRISPLFSYFPAACHYFGQVFGGCHYSSIVKTMRAVMPCFFSSQWASSSSLLCTHLIIKLCEPARLEYEISRPIMRSYAHSPIYMLTTFDIITLLLFILILSVSGICIFI